MILLKELFEAKPKTTDFSAISKKTGKLVYFDTKDNMDAAVKSGTHDKPKVKGKDIKVSKSSDLFKGDYEKERGSSMDSGDGVSNQIVNSISKKGYTSSIILHRKNKNGKVVRDVNFKSSDINSDIIKKVAEEEGIDLNLLNKFGVDKSIKYDGRTQSLGEWVGELIFASLEAKQYAPGEVAEDEHYHKVYSKRKNEISNLIKNKINKDNTDIEKKEANPKVEKQKYNSEEVGELDKAFSSMDDWGGFGDYNSTPKMLAQAANKLGIDINRVLSNPERFIEISGAIAYRENAKDYALQALGHTIYFANDRDSAYNLVDLQLAYPLKHKSLSDEEWAAKMKQERDNPTTVDASLRKYQTDEITKNKNWEDDAIANSKGQSNWVKSQAEKNKSYAQTMLAYQQMISKAALNDIDRMLVSNPPPPIKAQALYRGMAMKPVDLKRFLNEFAQGNTVKLPIASFSSDPSVAVGFANNVDNDNSLIDKSNNQAVVIKVVNSKNQFNGFSMNANIDNVESPDSMARFGNWAYQEEVLLPSNNKYKVLEVKTTKLDGGRSVTTITLEQIGIKNEIKLKELIDINETDILKKHLQYPNRLSLLYAKEGEN